MFMFHERNDDKTLNIRVDNNTLEGRNSSGSNPNKSKLHL